MTMTPHQLQTEAITDELALLEVGDYGSGKSWLAATMPGTNFFLDFDLRLSGLKMHPNAKNIYGMSFSDPTNTNVVPTAFNELLSVLGNLEKSPLLKNVHASFAGVGDKWVDTLIFDSIQTISDSARKYVLYSGGTGDGGVTKSFQIGGRTYRVAKNWHAWGGEMEMVTGAILQGRALLHCRKCAQSATYFTDPATGVGRTVHTANPTLDKDHAVEPKAMNVICILHECMEEDERSTEENPIYTGRIAVFPVRYRVLLKYFNEVWRLERTIGRIPKVMVDPDGKFTKAKTALGVTKIEVPDLAKVLVDAKSMRKV